MAGMQNVHEALAALPSLPPGSISQSRLQHNAMPGVPEGKPQPRLRRSAPHLGNRTAYFVRINFPARVMRSV